MRPVRQAVQRLACVRGISRVNLAYGSDSWAFADGGSSRAIAFATSTDGWIAGCQIQCPESDLRGRAPGHGQLAYGSGWRFRKPWRATFGFQRLYHAGLLVPFQLGGYDRNGGGDGRGRLSWATRYPDPPGDQLGSWDRTDPWAHLHPRQSGSSCAERLGAAFYQYVSVCQCVSGPLGSGRRVQGRDCGEAGLAVCLWDLHSGFCAGWNPLRPRWGREFDRGGLGRRVGDHAGESIQPSFAESGIVQRATGHEGLRVDLGTGGVRGVAFRFLEPLFEGWGCRRIPDTGIGCAAGERLWSPDGGWPDHRQRARSLGVRTSKSVDVDLSVSAGRGFPDHLDAHEPSHGDL